MKRFKKIKIILIVLAIVILPALKVFAVDNTYTVLAPLPGIGDSGGTTTLNDYIPALFKLLISLSAVFAVLMIVIGGFQYMTSDALMKKEEGKKRIQNAIYGLILVIGAWLILWTINPNLLTLNLNIGSATVEAPELITLGGELSAGTGGVLPGYTLTQAQVDTNTAMVNDLGKYHITVNNLGKPCADGSVSGCTNLVGMPAAAYSGVKQLETVCGDCKIEITGGTEGGHASHGPGLPALDLSSNNQQLNTYIANNQIAPVQHITGLGDLYTVKLSNSMNATFLQESNPPHWHAVFGK